MILKNNYLSLKDIFNICENTNYIENASINKNHSNNNNSNENYFSYISQIKFLLLIYLEQI